LGFSIPSTLQMQQIQQNILLAREDKNPCIAWGEVELRRYRDNIYAMKKLLLHDATQIIEWDLMNDLYLPGIGLLTKVMSAVSKVTVKFRQQGELCYLPGRSTRRELKKLFQEWNVPPWQRDRVPLVYSGELLIAAVGFFESKQFVGQII
jgi:tRNA(Ile)-lysidine synthase